MAPHLLLVAVAALAVSSALTSLLARRSPAAAVALSRGVALAAAGAAASALVLGEGAPGGGVGGGAVVADRLGTTVALFAASMTVLVGAYAARSLAADLRAPQFFAATNLLLAGTVALAASDRRWLTAGAWVVVSAATVWLISFDGRPASRTAARRAARRFVIGDGALVLGVAAATLSDDAAGPFLVAGVVVAALARSAQLPFQGWLADSVAAPTPVSALLHAGVVNGSAIVLIRWYPAVAAEAWAPPVLVALGLSGVVVGMAVARTRPDIKSGLAWTTVAQMGFMIVQCALGLAGPAVVHMIAHGMFKSRLFLGAASALEHDGHHHPHPASVPVATHLAAGAGATAVVAASLAIVRPAFLDHPAAVLPVVATWFTVTYALVQWWARRPVRTPSQVAVVLGTSVVLVTAATAASSAVDHWLGFPTTLAPAAATLLAVTAVVVIAAGWAATLVVRRSRPDVAAVAWMRAASLATPRGLGSPLVLAHRPKDPS